MTVDNFNEIPHMFSRALHISESAFDGRTIWTIKMCESSDADGDIIVAEMLIPL